LLCGDSSAFEFAQSRLPFVYQLRCLTRSPLGTGKHSFRMDALPCWYVWLAGGMIGHMILGNYPAHRGETYNRILYKLHGCMLRLMRSVDRLEPPTSSTMICVPRWVLAARATTKVIR